LQSSAHRAAVDSEDQVVRRARNPRIQPVPGSATRPLPPDVQARGGGKLLMAEIHRVARQDHIPVLILRSSVTAETFYARLGFRAVRDSYHGDERTILMQRSLDESL
jgi:histone acetyltransferase (RNA polymerase elongator complex component)